MSEEALPAEEHLVVRRGGQDDGPLQGKWLVEPPPEPDELRVIVQLGSELELTEPVREALEQLAATLQGEPAEVSGFAAGGLQIGLAPGPGLGSEAAAAGCIIRFGCDYRRRTHAQGGATGDLTGGAAGAFSP